MDLRWSIGGDNYVILGVSSIFSVDFGMGTYLWRSGEWGIRLEYVHIIRFDGVLAGTDQTAPRFIGWPGLLVSHKF